MRILSKQNTLVRKLRSQTKRLDRVPVVLVSLGVLFSISVGAMFAQTSRSAYEPRSTETKSRAEQFAEQQVALSPDKIIELLQQEPGLVLQVKRMLVRKAYEQGRILDPEDLTDDALFQLLREDQHICVLATQEIEERGYVRAKPTIKEIERQRVLDAQLGLTHAAKSQTPLPKENLQVPASQEQAYWEKHDDDVGNYAVPQQQQSEPLTSPSVPVVPRSNPPISNPQRQLEMTNLPSIQDLSDGMGVDNILAAADPSLMTRISPEQLPGILNTSSTTNLNMASLDGTAQSRSRSALTGAPTYGGNSPLLNSSLENSSLEPAPLVQRPGADLNGRTADRDLEAKLELPQRRVRSPEDFNLDRPQIRRRANPYANVPSLYDLYSQVSPRSAVLEHFGTNIFRNGAGNIERLPIDLPAGPDYVLGPGDGVSIDIWGGIAQRLQRVVDPSGRLALPEVGSVEVTGRTLGDVQHIVQAALRTQFHQVEADVSLSRIRTVRVYVVGEVENPGPYDISSLSTALNALYAAGGPTSRGSLRHLRIMRGKDLVQEVDAYDLLLHGVRKDVARLQAGDTIQVPATGPEVTVEGMVTHPAVYELNSEKTLAEALELAGGVLRSGTSAILRWIASLPTRATRCSSSICPKLTMPRRSLKRSMILPFRTAIRSESHPFSPTQRRRFT
jgi:protein involved in polysaccharide export with SLBB domain